MRASTGRLWAQAAAAGDPGLAVFGGTDDQRVAGELFEGPRRSPSLKVGRGGDEQPPRGLQPPNDKTRIRDFADPDGEVGALRDEILEAIRHHQLDLQKRMAVEETRKHGGDPQCAVSRRQRDLQHAAQSIGAAGGVLRTLGRRQRLARPGEQRLAGVGQRDTAGRAHQQFDAEAILQRRDRARRRRLAQAQLPRGLRKAPGLDRADEDGELLQTIIHAGLTYISCRDAV